MHKLIPILAVIAFVLLLGGAFDGCDNRQDHQTTYNHGQESGELRQANIRLLEAQQQAALRLEVEQRRAAALVSQIGTRRHVESMMAGALVLIGCALAATVYVLVRRRRCRS